MIMPWKSMIFDFGGHSLDGSQGNRFLIHLLLQWFDFLIQIIDFHRSSSVKIKTPDLLILSRVFFVLCFKLPDEILYGDGLFLITIRLLHVSQCIGLMTNLLERYRILILCVLNVNEVEYVGFLDEISFLSFCVCIWKLLHCVGLVESIQDASVVC